MLGNNNCIVKSLIPFSMSYFELFTVIYCFCQLWSKCVSILSRNQYCTVSIISEQPSYSWIPQVVCSKTIKSTILIYVYMQRNIMWNMMQMMSNNSQCDVKTIKFQMLFRCEGISKEAHTFSLFWGLKWRLFVVWLLVRPHFPLIHRSWPSFPFTEAGPLSHQRAAQDSVGEIEENSKGS